MPDEKLQTMFRCMPENEEPLRARIEYNLNFTLNRTLNRYFALLDAARRGLQGRFSEGDLGFLLDIENGILHEPFLAAENPVLLMDAVETMEMDPGVYEEKWQFSKEELLSKLKALTSIEQAALIDAIERWWRASATGIPVQVKDLLA